MKYATKNLNNPLKSSAGLKLNILGLTVTANLSLDNIGISGSVKNGDVTKSYGFRTNLSELKVGFQSSTTVQWDANTSQTTYTDVDVNGLALIAVYYFVTTGQPTPVPQPSY